MKSVELIETPKNQYFEGRKYHRENNSGYYVDSKTRTRLHVAVWTHNFGPVPHGCHIHHVDNNPANNDISNLVCLTARDHARIHAAMTPYDKQCEAMARAREKAPEWHKSEEGREWHAIHYTMIADKLRQEKEFTCIVCEDKYVAINNGSNKFCSAKCKNEYWKLKKKQKREAKKAS